MVDDMRGEIREAYSCRAAEYAAHFGSMGAVHPADRHLVATWADQIEGLGPGWLMLVVWIVFLVMNIVVRFRRHSWLRSSTTTRSIVCASGMHFRSS